MNRARMIKVAGMLLVSVATVTLACSAASGSSLQHFSGGDDDEHAGPDSARIASLLASLGTSDPLVCELIADQVGNFWSDGGQFGVGRFADAAATAQSAKDSLHGRVSAPAAIKVLVANLDAANPCVRRLAAKLLGRSKMETATLIALLHTGTPRVREAAAYALGSEDRKESRGELEKTLRAQGGPEAAMAAWALGEIGDLASVPLLSASLSYNDVRTARAAARALGEVHDMERAPLELEKAARSSDAILRRIAARSLAEIHDPASLDALIELVTIDDPHVRLSVVEALGQIGSAKATASLMKASRDPVAEVRRAAVEALGGIGKNQ